VVLACSVAFSGFRGIAGSGDLAVRLYDGPLMGINHARSAHAALNEARRLIPPSLADGVPAETVIAFRALLNEIVGDLKIVRERIDNDDVAAALAGAEDRFRRLVGGGIAASQARVRWPHDGAGFFRVNAKRQ